MNEIFRRVSVRNYQQKPVEPEKITRLLRAAMAAPSAGDQRPWEFFVTENRDVLAKLAGCSIYAGCLRGAALAIIPCIRKEGLYFPELAMVDTSAAVENMLLQAVSDGLGAVWLGIAPSEERMAAVADVLEIPNELEPFAIVSFGYPAEEHPQEDRYDSARVHVVK
jgi:nitroreductase